MHQWSSQLGSVTAGAGASSGETVSKLTLDGVGNIYIGGTTGGALGEENSGSVDVFISKFNSSGVYLWSSQLGNVSVGAGASGTDYVRGGLELDGAGNIYIGGHTNGALGETNSGNYDAFIAKFDSLGNLTP